ncbi:GNAT family N-acetyltransferase [Bacillus sp. CGMCC 1.16607]|uniref:GNAT family N-acetyltransferase n=1 Tax=Bacillus sp. CGMCC 1.16607 TaxID=3351842 RepID=UPI003644DBF9
MTIKWEEITQENMIHLESVLRLYDHSFPIEVREPHEMFFRSLRYAKVGFPNHFRLLVGFEGDELVSFATGHYLAKVNTGFIVYIAINPLIRNKGLGTLTLLKLEEILNEDARLADENSLKAIVLETEMEELALTEIEKEDCRKRGRFFQKNGYNQYGGIEYVQPPLHKDGISIPLNLYIKNCQMDRVSNSLVKEIIQEMYKEKYDEVNGIDKSILNRCLSEMGI